MPPKTRSRAKTASQPSSSPSKRKRSAVSKPSQTRATSRSTTSSEVTSPSLQWPFRDQNHKDTFERLELRGLLCTRYMDDHALEMLGLNTEVNDLMNNFGWAKFVTLKSHTHTQITLEFLSSFDCDLHSSTPSYEGVITFRLMGVERRHTLASFNEIFGFPSDGVRSINETNFCADEVWGNFTDTDLIGSYNSRSSKSSQIKSPTLRYIHRFLAHSIFGRGESTGVVNKNELFLLWAMTQGIQVNMAVWMCNQFYHIRNGTGKICIGGLISSIAHFHGFIPTPDRVFGTEKIDLDTLVLMGICKKVSGRYQLITEATEIIPRQQPETRTSSQTHAAPTDRRGASTSTPPPPPTATASATAAQTPTATASASHPTTAPAAGPITLEMLMAKLECMETQSERREAEAQERYRRLETHMMESFGHMRGQLEDITKKLDDTTWND